MHYSTAKESDIVEHLRSLTKKWGGIAAVLTGGVSLVYHHHYETQQIKAEIQSIRNEIRAFSDQYISDHTINDNGFSDPRIRLALDAHIRRFLSTYTFPVESFKREINQWRKSLFDLNPQLKKPTE